MKTRVERLKLILKVKSKATQQMLSGYSTIRSKYEQEKQKYHQLIQYKKDYSQQLSNKGKVGITMDKMKHVLNFINQLDQLISQQFEQINNLQKQVGEAHNSYLDAKIEEDTLNRLIEKLISDVNNNESRLLQKQCDEMIQNLWHAKKLD